LDPGNTGWLTFMGAARGSGALPCAPLSVDEEISFDDFNVWPTLVDREMNIKSMSQKIDRVEIFNANGQLVDRISTSSALHIISTQNWTNGTYYISAIHSNGNFATGTTGWTASTTNTLTAVNGRLRNTLSTANYGYAYQTVSFVNGRTYYLRANGYPGNSAAWKVAVHSGAGAQLISSPTQQSADGVYTATYTATANDAGVTVRLYTDTSDDNVYAEFDNVMLYDLTADAAVDTAAGITQLLTDNNVTYHDGAQNLRYENYLTMSGATPYGHSRYFDGSDDYGSAMNSPALDITTAPLSVFATIRTPPVLQTGWVVGKNLDATANMQYGFLISNTGEINIYFEGAQKAATAAGSLVANETANIGFLWDGTKVAIKKNGRQLSLTGSGAYSGTLTSRPYFRVARRETAAVYFKGWMDTLCLYTTRDFNAVDEHQRWLMRRKGILG
jgi:hypothetical protein